MNKRNSDVSRRTIQTGKPSIPVPVEAKPVVLQETDAEMYLPPGYRGRAKDYSYANAKELYAIFALYSGAKLHDSKLTDAFVYSLLRQLGYLDVLDTSICLRDRSNITKEILNAFTRNLALYLIHPQRYGHRSRNVLASTLVGLMWRLSKYLSGHNLGFKTRYPVSKKEFGNIVTFIDDSPYIWLLAEMWEKAYYRRVKQGYTDPI